MRAEPARISELMKLHSAVRLEKALIGVAAAIMLMCGGWLLTESAPSRLINPKSAVSLPPPKRT